MQSRLNCCTWAQCLDGVPFQWLHSALHILSSTLLCSCCPCPAPVPGYHTGNAMHKWGECSRGLEWRLRHAFETNTVSPSLAAPAACRLPPSYCPVPAHPAQTPQPPSAQPALPPTLPPGHMRLRAILNREPPFPSAFKGAPVIAQFSSLGSIEDKWCALSPSTMPFPPCWAVWVGSHWVAQMSFLCSCVSSATAGLLCGWWQCQQRQLATY